jgi:hypothetical protein
MTLGNLAKLIRSKNAGPFMLTIDVLFDDSEAFERVVAAQILTRDAMAQLFGTDPDDVEIYVVRAALAVKVSMPRIVPSGSIHDTDVFGGQQFAPLVDLEVPT